MKLTDVETEALVNLWGEENVENELDDYSMRNNVIYGLFALNQLYTVLSFNKS